VLVLGVLALANLAGMADGSKVGVFNGARQLQVSEPTLFAGRHLGEGVYRLDWEMTAGTDRAPVRLFKGKQLIYSTEGAIVKSQSEFPYDSVAYTRHASGNLEISEIRFAGSRLTISLKDATLTSTGQP